MSLSRNIADELQRLVGYSAADPTTVTLSGPDQVSVDVDLTNVDRMSCALREVRVNVPALVDADLDLLRQWAEALCRRVTYLLENIGPLELDEDAGRVLIRSTPPDKQADATTFYEIMLRSHADGNFSLRRYRSEQGRSGRDQVDIQTTHEVLGKLVVDLVETIPG